MAYGLYIINGFMREWPEGYPFQVDIPDDWFQKFVDPSTFQIYSKSIFPPVESGCPWEELPLWVIEDPYFYKGWFLFQDEQTAIEFKLKYL